MFNIIKLSFFILFLLISTTVTLAGDIQFQNLDQHRPDDISDNKWSNLKTAIQEIKLVSPADGVGGSGGKFGTSVTFDGNRAIVGAPNVQGQGVVYVFEFDGTYWLEKAVLRPSIGDNVFGFGYSVSMYAGRILIGAYKDDSNKGSAFIFDYVNEEWLQTTKLTASDGVEYDHFGWSVSLSADRALIGAFGADNYAGKAYVFDYTANNWSQTTILLAVDRSPDDLFGTSVSLSGNRVIIGASGDDSYAGSAYIFDYVSSWSQSSKLTATLRSDDDEFGWSVSLAGNRALIGATGNDDNASNAGAAYVFENLAGSWSQSQQITATDGLAGDNFGWSLSLSTDRLVVGVKYGDNVNNNSGSAYIFDNTAGTWLQSDKVHEINANANNNFGVSVALFGDKVLVGSLNDDENGQNSGSAFIFSESVGSWNQVAKLFSSEGYMNNDGFGYAVSLVENKAVVGAPNAGIGGVVYVFDYDSGNWTQTDILIAADSAIGDSFGGSVSLSKNSSVYSVLIGAVNDDDNGGGSGSAYVFDNDGGNWSQKAKLLASDGLGSDLFGSSVGLSSSRAVIGAKNKGDSFASSGAVYVFNLAGGNWSQANKLLASDASTGAKFGTALSLSTNSNRILIGASGGSGAAYIFDYAGGTWSQTDKLTANVAAANDYFGFSVSLSGERALIGAYGNDTNATGSGAAYIFDNNAGNWSQSEKLTAIDWQQGARFGWSVSLRGDRVLIGAYFDNQSGTSSGSVYVFEKPASIWSQTAKLTAADGSSGDNFGYSVSLDSFDRLFVGAKGEDENGLNAGAAYVFETTGTGQSSWLEKHKVIASNPNTNDKYGYAVSISGNHAIVGAYLSDDYGIDSGSAFIYYFDGNIWLNLAKLYAPDRKAGQRFGNSVSIENNRAVVGAYYDDANGSSSGAIYVFDFYFGYWRLTNKLLANDGSTNDFFGNSVSLSGNRILVSAHADDDVATNTGSAYIFEFNGLWWSQTAKLKANDPQAYDYFAKSVSLYGDRALIGAHFDDDDGSKSGSAYVFDKVGNSWSQTTKLTASDAQASDEFGLSVSLSNNRALIGAHLEDANGTDSGSAYVYEYNGATWSESEKLMASDGVASDYFGYSVSLSGDKILIGAYKDDDNGSSSGSVYKFAHAAGSWSEDEKLTTSDAALADYFGYSVAISGDKAFVGAYGNDDNGSNSGSAYIFNLNPIYKVAGTVSGLATNNSVILKNNNGNDLTIITNGLFEFTTPIVNGLNYAVTVSVEPTTPNQTCLVTGGDNNDGTGIINQANVTNIIVSCTTNKYTIGGTLVNLGANILLQNNGGDNLITSNNGSFTFSQSLDDLSNYAVIVQAQPTNQHCVITGGDNDNGVGVLAGENISNIVVTCTTNNPPVVTDDSYTTNEDIVLYVTNPANGVLANDTDESNIWVLAPGPHTTQGVPSTIFLESDGTFIFTPRTDMPGQSFFTYDLTDGTHIVSATVTFNIQAVNDAPSFSIQGDIDASLAITPPNTIYIQNSFANNLIFGPSDEQNSQSVQQFNTSIISDSNNILSSINVTNTGTMNIDFTLNYGVAIIGLSMQDDGLTANGGIDTSSVVEFNVIYLDDLIYRNGFEAGSNFKLLDYINTIKVNDPANEAPYYDFESNTLQFYGSSLELGNDYSSNIIIQKVETWMREVLIYLNKPF